MLRPPSGHAFSKVSHEDQLISQSVLNSGVAGCYVARTGQKVSLPFSTDAKRPIDLWRPG